MNILKLKYQKKTTPVRDCAKPLTSRIQSSSQIISLSLWPRAVCVHISNFIFFCLCSFNKLMLPLKQANML